MDVLRFPGWRYGPDGESEIFENEDQVPSGWTDNPNDHAPKGRKSSEAPKEPKPPEVSPYDGWTVEQITDELTKRDITFNKNWPEKKLFELLVKSDEKK